ncbi:MAG: Gfo/Idh/MocA family oxidoreductase [Rhizobiaceae bacterium]
MTKVRILILGTGGMAKSHAEAYAAMDTVELVAGVDVNEQALQDFCDLHAIEHRFTSLQQALDWGDFDAVSNVTPDALHHKTTMPLLVGGKHVLCEKPLATNYADAKEMADAAGSAKVINMVNLTYRNVAAMQKASELVATGVLGQIRHFEASYLQSWLTQPAWGDWKSESQWLWRLSTQHGSKGVLGDIGIHILDFVSHVAGSLPREVACRLKTFHKAEGDQIGEYVLDANDSFAMNVELENGAIGVVSASRFASGHHNDLRLRLYGDKGGIEVGFEKKVSKLRLCVGEDIHSETWRDVEAPSVKTNYQRFVDAVISGQQTDPGFDLAAALQMALDCAESSDQQDGRRLLVKS